MPEIEDVKKIVNKHDPMNLISSGAPDDEYNMEVSQILGILEKDSGVKKMELSESIKSIFISTFDESTVSHSPQGVYEAIAKEILDKRVKGDKYNYKRG